MRERWIALTLCLCVVATVLVNCDDEPTGAAPVAAQPPSGGASSPANPSVAMLDQRHPSGRIYMTYKRVLELSESILENRGVPTRVGYAEVVALINRLPMSAPMRQSVGFVMIDYRSNVVGWKLSNDRDASMTTDDSGRDAVRLAVYVSEWLAKISTPTALAARVPSASVQDLPSLFASATALERDPDIPRSIRIDIMSELADRSEAVTPGELNALRQSNPQLREQILRFRRAQPALESIVESTTNDWTPGPPSRHDLHRFEQLQRELMRPDVALPP